MGGAGLPKGRLVIPVDTSTSTVIKPGHEPQIQIGRTAVDTHADVVYSGELKMDVLVPRTAGLKPVIVFAPGGGFMFSAKEMCLDARTFVAEAGFVVASIQYRTIPDDAVYRDSVADVLAAVQYLRDHAADYGIDPSRAALWGESAGGYLVSMAALTGDVQSVLNKFGGSDLSRATDDFDEESRQAFIPLTGAFAHYTNGFSADANPLTHITPDAPPFLIMHGNEDTLMPPSQTLILHNALVAAGVDSTHYIVDGAGHGDVQFAGPETGLPWTTEETMGIIVEFFTRTLK
jgi:acetyl esterase/lipase